MGLHCDDDIDGFVVELLRTGVMLSELAADLIESLPSDAYPGEEPGHVILEMMCGTIRTTLASADPRDVRRATELIAQAAQRTIEHLRLAQALSRRVHGEGGPSAGRAYG
ncbi:MAG TPA: hypothetical protein VE127_04485 [Solirubrobacteraceae bacterium]|nr:hypothetical protein [Solirubrobacteraceae bacterium]